MMEGLLRRAGRKSGLAPGTLLHVGEERDAPVRITIIDFDAERMEEREVTNVEDCFPYRDQTSVTWINVDGVHHVDVVERLGRHFGLHPLLLEDIVHTNQRPKLEDFEDYVYIVLRMLYLKEGVDQLIALENEQISIVLGSNVVMTFQEQSGDVFTPIRDRIRENRGRVRKVGADYLAYAIMDIVVDNYFAVLERFGDELEELETALIEAPASDVLHDIHRMKRIMLGARRAVWPLRDVISVLLRGDNRLFKKSTLIFLRDVYDHTVRVVDITETLREMVAGMHDLYLSRLSNRLNEVMKVLTVIATIFIPLSFIAGVYGMNFDNMPELHWRYGYWYVWGVMVAVGLVMLVLFRRRRWL